jgi:lipopolysaccharide/colanic/teichoic acid biosynthesis glycosyltransferase
MMRIKGFARNTSQRTKGGSLSSSGEERANSSTPRSFWRTYFRDVGGSSKSNREPPSTLDREHLSGPDHILQVLRKTIVALAASASLAKSQSAVSSPEMAPGETGSEATPPLIAHVPEGLPVVDRVANQMPRWKRRLDLTFIVLSSPLWFPLLLMVMIWVKFVSPGAVFYRQKRIGHEKRCFMLFKLRTMHVDVETTIHEAYFEKLMRSDCAMTKLDAIGDARLIRGGRFLRATGLDELPQIFNVIAGEMSIVGPRPCLPCEFERYQKWQQERTNVFPGLTGYWQVNGKNKTTFSEMIAMDLFYAKNLSLRLDLKILLKTIPVLMRQGADSRRVPKTPRSVKETQVTTILPSRNRAAKS